jgi:Bor protein
MRPVLISSLALLLLAGCAEHRLVVKQPNPGSAPQQVNSAAIGWGASQERNVANCPTNIIDEVRVKQNVGQSLLSILTLGIYMPTTIEYVRQNTFTRWQHRRLREIKNASRSLHPGRCQFSVG